MSNNNADNSSRFNADGNPMYSYLRNPFVYNPDATPVNRGQTTAVSLPAPAPVPRHADSAKAPEDLKTPNLSSRPSGDRAVRNMGFDRSLDVVYVSDVDKEEHDNRLKDLRKQLEYIADTNWKYSPIEKYIGQI